MTISSENRKAGPYDGDGISTEFPFAFKVFSASDLLVIRTTPEGVESTLAGDGSDYSVTLNANQNVSPGGTIILTSVLDDDFLLTITSKLPNLQPTDITNQGGFYPQVVNASLDRLTILIQQLAEGLSRAIKVPISSDEDATPDALMAQLQAAIEAASNSAGAAENSALQAAISEANALLDAIRAEDAAAQAEDAASRAEATSGRSFIDEATMMAATPVEIGERVVVTNDPNDSPENPVNGVWVATGTGVGDWTRSEWQTATRAEVDDLTVRVNGVDSRTEGINSQTESVHPYEIVDAAGKTPFYITDVGVTTMPGGAETVRVESPNIVLNGLDRIVGSESSDPYPHLEMDRNGRVLWATLPGTGEKLYLGFPLHNHRGPLSGDFFAIGDSITAYGVAWSGANASGTSYSPCLNDQSWHAWASMKTKGRLRLTGISATGGYTVTQVKNVHLPNAIVAKPTFCVVMCGRNDIVQGLDIDTVTIPAFKSIFLQLRRAGIIPVVCTMSAHGNSSNNTRRIAEHRLNAWLRAYAKQYALPFVDLHRYTVDPLTGDWISGYNQDVSHPNGTGASAMGDALIAGLEDWTATTWTARADEQIAAGLSQNLIQNALFLTNDGINPTDWTISTEGTSVIETDAEVKGNVWTFSDQESYLTVAATTGQRMQLGFFAKTASQFDCYVVAGDSSSTTNLAGIRNWKTNISDLGYFSYEFVVPDGITQLTVKTKAASAACSLAQISLIKLTEI
ncbi:GDSL-like Lipase/Acylhydrolase family protein [Methylobacillus rhizosphaerae]|uniref:GDSL-like Lipase/Acylhydrolase family protein n=1 Tax=Methylobacillus rhizosphaerae TaxID=551994 RepID=A0A238YTR4_9PROT|nr:GDSL-type esterase/lipase family protein [Methylobacillus rhizosphaerae]SNR73849.1 GDSL-like Lipase/Acylhydrolase family protein [Methylobacillus rhizosphaerae]